jgi:hypothetical protein
MRHWLLAAKQHEWNALTDGHVLVDAKHDDWKYASVPWFGLWHGTFCAWHD